MQKPKENNDATDSFNAYWPSHLINNTENKRKERACMYKKKKEENIWAEAIDTIDSCMSLNK